jgi:transcriptional regulator of acetoin/glycerol metabolism
LAATLLTDTAVDTENSRSDPSEPYRFALLWLFPDVHVHVFEPGKGPWRFGRGSECEVHVDDHRASREHAQLSFKGPVVSLRDLGSTNGTHVNGFRIEEVPITAGSVLRIGGQVGVFCMAPASAEGASWYRELSPRFWAGPTLQRVIEPLSRAAASDLPILIVGDTGTGKERVAEYIHQLSRRAGRFHAINCATIPADLAESQLFGHKQGAFTGAQSLNVGHFRAADGGTLFLDEIMELPAAVQAKLLRALQERTVIPLGDTKAVEVDVRVVAACQTPADGGGRWPLRMDLMARLRGLTVELPALASRREEIPFLFMRFLRRHAAGPAPRVDGKLVERLCLYSWPGNVRELELLARQLLAIHAAEGVLRREHLPAAMLEASLPPQRRQLPKTQCELQRLARALKASRGNVSRATASVGMSRARAYRLIAGEPIATFVGKHCPDESS